MSRRRTKEGYLNVKQSGRFGKSWKRKWVVAQPNNTRSQVGELAAPSMLLELYVEKGAYGKTVNSVLIEGATEIRRVFSKSNALAFEVKKENDTLLAAAGESEADSQEWVAMFRQQLLLIRKKELTKLPDANEAAYRVSVIPNKYSENLQLSGDMLAHVTSMTFGLYDLYEGTLIKEWDLRHTKKFSLQSKGPQKDVDKIAIIQISNRSPHGAGDLHLFSLNAKSFLEKIYENLNTAMDVKSKRTRTSSMLFEIPPKELELLGKEIKEGPTSTTNGVDTNGLAQKEGAPSVSSETQSNEVEKDIEKTSEGKSSSTSDVSKEKEDGDSVAVAPAVSKSDTPQTDEAASNPSTDVKGSETGESKTEVQQNEESKPTEEESSAKEETPTTEPKEEPAEEPKDTGPPSPETKTEETKEELQVSEEREAAPKDQEETTEDSAGVESTPEVTKTVEGEEEVKPVDSAGVESTPEETKTVKGEEDVKPVEETNAGGHTQEAVAEVHSSGTPTPDASTEETGGQEKETENQHDQENDVREEEVKETASTPGELETEQEAVNEEKKDDTTEASTEEETQITKEEEPSLESAPPVEVKIDPPGEEEETKSEQPPDEANTSKTEDGGTQTSFGDEDENGNDGDGDSQSKQPDDSKGSATEDGDEGTSIE